MLRPDETALSTDDFDPFAGPAIARTAPATAAQREIWAAAQLGPDASCAFNEANSLSFTGDLDTDALRAALHSLVQRHEALRTTFSADGALLLIADEPSLELAFEDLSRLGPDASRRRLELIRAAEVQTPFDLEHGPLLRARLVRLAPDEHVLLLTAHHIVCDGWSTGLLLRELARLYTAGRTRTGAGLPAPTPFSTYASDELARIGAADDLADERYWLGQFADQVPVVELPTDSPRPALRTYNSARIDRALDAALVAELKAVAHAAGASFFSTLLASFDGLLHRLTGQTDLVVGIATAGQAATGMADVVGHCVNTLPIRARIDPEAPFRALLGQVRGVLLDATEHQLYTFGRLLQQLPLSRDPARAPLVSILFNLDAGLPKNALSFAGLQAEFASNPRRYENFELFVNAVEQDGGLRIECQYNTDLFAPETVARWLEAYEVLLRAVSANVDQPVGALSVLTPWEHTLLEQVNNTRAGYPQDACTYQLVEQQCQARPEAVAVSFEDSSLTYGELDRASNRLARRLRALGAGPDVLVGLCLERSPALPVAMLGIHKAGAAYVPIDPAYPADRIAFMLRDSGLPILVTEQALRGHLPAHTARVLCLDGQDDAAAIAAESDSPLTPLSTPDHLAYVIYTSGSTGQPKGVQIPHRALLNFLSSMRREPGISPQDILVAVTTLSFDIAGLELWLPLLVGARIVLASRDTASDGVLLRTLIEREQATMMQATPATWRQLLEAGWQGGQHFKILCGGEALPRDLARTFARCSASAWNLYGPTETTIWSTIERLTPGLERVMIGRPIANTSVHVLDSRLNPVPVGAAGELYIGGDGLARGYLSHPELTAERFVPRPSGGPGKCLYRTGDLVRLHADGRLEYLGRNDFQVKVRGYRIELGEIEATLARHPAVAQAVAVAREDRPGDVRLVAYVLPSSTPATEAELRDWLRSALPEYMLPQHLVSMDAFPLTPNGKVDRRALPEPAAQARVDAYEAPRDETEQLVAQIWQAVLGIGRLGRHDDFFALGGHSLLAAQVMARLDRDHGIAVPLRRIFEAPTVAQFAALLHQSVTASTRIPRRPADEPAPLSLMQQRLWFVEQLQPLTCLYNLPAAGRISGPLDVDALERALDYLAQRHESIRTTIQTDEHDARQAIAPDLHLPLRPVQDLSDVPAEERENVLRRHLAQLAEEPFDLTRGPLMRARLFRLGNEEHVLFFMPHHVIWDGWSFDIFHRELAVAYEAFRVGGQPSLPDLPIRYADFAAWHREWLQGPELDRLTAYWKGQLAGELQPLELPTDHPRPAVQSSAGGTEWFAIPRDEVTRLTELGRTQGATLFMVLVAAYQALLHRWTTQEDIRVGTPVRARSLPEVQDVIGLFVNAVVLRTRVEPQLTFRQLVERVRATTLDAFSHEDMPFEVLVKELDVPRDLSRTPIYQAFFSFQDATARDPVFGNCVYEQVHVLPPAAATDLSFWVMQTREGLAGGLNYSADLFEAQTAARFLGEYRSVLRSALANPDQPIAELDILPADERGLLDTFNATGMDYPSAWTAAELVGEQAARTPDAVAVEFDGCSLSYQALDTRSSQLAHRLRRRGVGPDTLVGICLERSLDLPVALLAVHKAGGAYVPLDPGFPTERLAFMAADARLKVLITQDDLRDLIPGHRAEVVCVDSERASIETEPTTLPQPLASPDNLAYVIYTSGSTGKPKGVEISHRALLNFLCSMRQEPGLSADDVLVAVTTLSFDIAGLELWLPLLVGARVVLASREVAADGEQLHTLMNRSGATVMQATPTTWRLLLADGWRGGAHFKAICGGEALPLDLARELAEHCAEVWNMYGPTETTIWSTLWRVPAGTDQVRIGRPIGNTQVYVLDDRLQAQPVGVPGDLYIAGAGLARGYLNRPELTAERFIPSPFAAPGARIYKTGDRARWCADGTLEFLGRNDFQVKIRGYRVELGEIEAALAQHPAVLQAVAVVREDLPGGPRLVAYVVPTEGEDYTVSELRRHLRSTLPDYMVPQHFVELDRLPLTPNAKVDRKALPAPFHVSPEVEQGYVPPRTRQEQLVAEIWQSALGTSAIGIHDNFFHLGGHSLLCLQVIAHIEHRTGLRLSPRVILLNSLEQIAALLPAAA